MDRRNAWLLIAVALVFGGLAVVGTSAVHLPGNHQDYEPVQPIAFSHRLHAGELEIDCLYCHSGAAVSRHAGIPAAGLCMNCHRTVTAAFDTLLAERQLAAAEEREPRTVVSAELRKLYDALGLGPDLAPDSTLPARPIEWVRVHNLPDYVYFDHRAHVGRSIACEQCHGPVRSMERIRQVENLSMGWCLACHRSQPADPTAALTPASHVSTDCASCHF